MSGSSHTPRLFRLALGVLPVISLAACGSDSDSGAADAASSTPSLTTAPISAFCDSLVALDAIDSPGGPTDPTPAQLKEYGSTLRPLVDTLRSAAPASVDASIATVTTAIDRLDSGDGSALASPDFSAATEAIEQAGRSNCGFTAIDVGAKNYQYDGAPTTVPAGRVSFTLTNTGTEPHLLLFVHKPDDVKDDLTFLQDYLGAVFSGSDAAMQQYAPYNVSGGGPFAAPGTATTHVTDFAPGTYIYFCPIPVGGTESGAPHFTQGMHGEFTVTG
jgi:hypothetical protein